MPRAGLTTQQQSCTRRGWRRQRVLCVLCRAVRAAQVQRKAQPEWVVDGSVFEQRKKENEARDVYDTEKVRHWAPPVPLPALLGAWLLSPAVQPWRGRAP